MPTRIKLRNDIAANWTANNPILAKSEPGYETNTKKLKIGDGVKNWNDLDYFVIDNIDHNTLINTHNLTTDIDHNTLKNYGANEHINWTLFTAGLIHPSNYVDNDTKDHLAFSNIGTKTHAQIDTHLADGTKHFLVGSISHLNIANIGTNTHPVIDTHLANSTKHFLEASINHLNISNIGNNSHAQLDTFKTNQEAIHASGCKVKGNLISAQSVGNNVWTRITYKNEDYDIGSEFNTGTYRFTANNNGYYQINASLLFNTGAWTAGNRLILAYRINNAEVAYLSRWAAPVTGTYIPHQMLGSDINYLNAGQYIDFWVIQNSGGTRFLSTSRLYNWASIHRLS